MINKLKNLYRKLFHPERPLTHQHGVKFNRDKYIEQIVRDKNGKWVTDNEGKLVYKNDEPARIKKFVELQEKQTKAKTDCGDNCKCKKEK